MSAASSIRALGRNRDFRRLWFGDAVSLFGDWFTYVAVGTLVLDAGEGLIGVAVLLLGHSLPRAVLAPVAGRIVDRFDRRTIMVVASLLRAATVVAMVFAAEAEALVALQVLVFVRVGFSAFIDPAATAVLPQIVPRALVGQANAVLGATWSAMFGLGVVAGGALTAGVGPSWALGVDALTFLLSAAVFWLLPRSLPGGRRGAEDQDDRPAASGVLPVARGGSQGDPGSSAGASQQDPGSAGSGSLSPLSEGGWSIAWARPEVLRAVLAKVPAALANGGGWVLLHQIAGSGIFGATAVGLALLHAARAVGTGVGPLLWAGRLRGSTLGLWVSTALSLVAVGLFAVVEAPWLVLAVAGLWGVGVGANWVTAVTRTQVLTDNEQLGRVASLDLVTHSLAQGVGGLVGAVLADVSGAPEMAAWWGAGGGFLAWIAVEGLVWASSRRRADEEGGL